jgi:hypothetical protein
LACEFLKLRCEFLKLRRKFLKLRHEFLELRCEFLRPRCEFAGLRGSSPNAASKLVIPSAGELDPLPCRARWK